MARKSSSSCAICENSNLAFICAACVNHRLIDSYNLLKSLRSTGDSLYSRLDEKLVQKRKADDQLNWRLDQNEKLKKLRERLSHLKKQLSQEKAKVEERSNDLNLRYGLLDSAFAMLQKNRVELLEKFTNIIYTQNLGHMAITSERLHKQSMVIKQICKLFPIRRRLYCCQQEPWHSKCVWFESRKLVLNDEQTEPYEKYTF